MKSIAVSIIMPLYNVEKYIRQCLDTVVKQTLKNIEIICVNDCSTDNTLKIINEYKVKDHRIKVITQEHNGCAAARNTGLAIAKGEFVTFLDGDDFFELSMLKTLYNKAKEDDSEIVICGCYHYSEKYKHIEKTKIPAKFYLKKSPFSPYDLKDNIYNIGGPVTWNKIIKRRIFIENNLKFEDVVVCNDLTCIDLALVLAKKISVIGKPYIYYRLNQPNNLTANRTKYPESFLTSIQLLENKLKDFGLYDTFKNAFKKKMKSSFQWELSLCKLNEKLLRKEMAKKLLSDDLYETLFNEEKNPVNLENNMSKISVVIPVYNSEKYLSKCLDTIINQTFKNLEIICIDDGSTDKSLEILNKYKEKDDRIHILTQQNEYAGAARNKGLSIATGDYIIFLDSDDFFELDMLEKMHRKIVSDNSDVVVCGYYNYDNIKNEVIDIYYMSEDYTDLSPFKAIDIVNNIFNFCRPNPWTKLFKRDLFIKNNLKFDTTICSNDMSCIYSALATANSISILNSPLIYYRLNQKNNLTAKRRSNLTGFTCDLKAYESLKQNLINLKVYDIFKKALFLRVKESFKNFKKQEYKEIAKSILSNDLYQIFCSEE